MLGHKGESLADIGLGTDGYRVVNHTVLGPLYSPDLLALSFDGHILVNDTNTSGACHRYCQIRLGDGIHG